MKRLLPAGFIVGLLSMMATPAFAQHRRAEPAPPSPTPALSSVSAPPAPNRGGDSPGSDRAVPRENGNNNGNGNGRAPRNGGDRNGSGGYYPWGYTYGGMAGAFGGYYGGYAGGYDPWYGWTPMYTPVVTGSSDYYGWLRLKVKPVEASVYVDGYYVGIVDDYDGIFQRLKLEPGPHSIEIRGQEYQTLSVNVQIREEETTTYRGELTKRP